MTDTPFSALPEGPTPPGAVRSALGTALYRFSGGIFPICRSLTGEGVRQTLTLLSREIPGFVVEEIPSGQTCFDWVIPPEWNISEAWIEGPDGSRIVDFKNNNLHVVSYSEPVDAVLDRAELDAHLYSIPHMPDAIPYVTSYYERRWGFCLPHRQRESLPEGRYRVVIRSRLEPGSLTYGHIVIPGEQKTEILLSTYVCHPSMANNEVSGVAVTAFLARWLIGLPRRRYSYRVLFTPETIGTVAYLSRYLDAMKDRTHAGFVMTMIGDDRGYSATRTPSEMTIADRVSSHVLKHICAAPRFFPYTQRASDERQYCAPGVDLPVVALMRAGRYPEYHTSGDDMGLISPAGLFGGFDYARLCILALEQNMVPHWTTRGEPQLSRHGLRKTLGARTQLEDSEWVVSNLLAFADGKRDLLTIADLVGKPIWTLAAAARELLAAGLLRDAGDMRSSASPS